MQTVLISGSSGFIGSYVAQRLLQRGDQVIGYDNENDYYDVRLKHARRQKLEKYDNFIFYEADLEDNDTLTKVFAQHKPNKVFNSAAQAGVRYSLENPRAYIQSNIIGFFNIIELSKQYDVQNFVYASSSSVYGKNDKIPFCVDEKVDHPVSLYAATKKSNELIAHTYSHLYGLPTTGLRFFTVYGPWGRPDMAYFKFAQKIVNDEPIDVYNHGKMERDFTYIDDIVDGVIKALDNPHDYEIFNLGNHNIVSLEYFIQLLEQNLGKQAIKNYMDMQPGDVYKTYADVQHTLQKLNWQATTNIEQGLAKTVEWFKDFYNV